MSAFRLLSLAAITATASACASAPTSPTAASLARTPTEQWSGQIAPQPLEVRLAVHASGLSGTQAQALTAFAADWREVSGGPIALRAPVGSIDPAAVARISDGARAILVQQGVPASSLSISAYDASGSPAAPLVIVAEGQVVRTPACGRAWTNIAHSAGNEVQPNFGCAVTANMASQVANPADLARATPSAPADAQRRAVVLGKYRQGQVTSSEVDSQATGAVSTVVK
jgi:pilus assembly protein CpaD